MAYTKYSLTPADNNAAPPNGAPEGMLPSAVNDTMRDMMAQIRDVGDGIRGGTYTMTSPVITGGSVTGVTALTTSGNLTFTGTGNRITGDFSNATVANSVAFQSSTTNGNTNVQAIPNGTGTASQYRVYNNSDANNSSFGQFFINASESRISSAITGTGTYLPLTMFTGGSERLRIDTSGNVGVGTSVPTNSLSISNSVNYAALSFDWTGDNAAKARIGANHGTGEVQYWATTNYFPTFYSNNAERMRIDSSGNLLVGTTANGGLTGNIVCPAIYNRTSANAANMGIDAAFGMFRSTSSIKYKKDVQDAVHGLTELLSLRPVTYKGKNDGDTVFGGLIAEEVHNAGLTEFVQYAEDGSPDALAYGHMVSLCVKAIQELSASHDALKATVDAQAARIAALEAK